MSVIGKITQHITYEAKNKGGFIMYLTIIYAKNLFPDRELLWQELIDTHAHIDDAWMLTGDFDIVLKPTVKKGDFQYLFRISEGSQIV